MMVPLAEKGNIEVANQTSEKNRFFFFLFTLLFLMEWVLEVSVQAVSRSTVILAVVFQKSRDLGSTCLRIRQARRSTQGRLERVRTNPLSAVRVHPHIRSSWVSYSYVLIYAERTHLYKRRTPNFEEAAHVTNQ